MKIAPCSCFCCNPCQKALLVCTGNNGQASVPLEAFNESSGSPASTFYALISRLALIVAPVLAIALIRTLVLTVLSTDINILKHFIKAYMEA